MSIVARLLQYRIARVGKCLLQSDVVTADPPQDPVDVVVGDAMCADGVVVLVEAVGI